MGVKRFFAWLQSTYADCIHIHNSINGFTESVPDLDVLALDLNGIFHPVAQKTFQYGEYKTPPSLLRRRKSPDATRMFEGVCKRIEEIVFATKPRKKLILCVDGVAGCSKMSQQRSRRFKTAVDRKEGSNDFDPNSMTPGTHFMDSLTRYIYWFIHKKIEEDDEWKKFEVIFSNEKVPGEGEAKAFSYVRTECDKDDSFCIFGLDADLIMLSMASKRKNVYVYRENMYNKGQYLIVDIDRFSEHIKNRMKTQSAIVDFVFLCFMVGNDFLPQIPTLEIFNGGIEALLNIYEKTCVPFGIINTQTNQLRINTFLQYISELAKLEPEILTEKYRKSRNYFPDEILQKNCYYDEEIEGNIICDFKGFRQDYYNKKLKDIDIPELSKHYIKGMQWVIDYYVKGIPSWNWQFPEPYAPFLIDIANCTDYVFKDYKKSTPYLPFQQLLAVLPPQSRQLIPHPLNKLLSSKKSPIAHYYPSEFEIDLSGKKAEWEGIVILPTIDMDKLVASYSEYEGLIAERDIKRNRHTLPQKFYYDKNRVKELRSRFGTIPRCHVHWKNFNA